MRSMLSTHLRDLFPPSDCNIVLMKFSSMHPFGFAAIKFRKGLETRIQDTTVASSDNSLKPFSLNMLLLDMPVLVLSLYRAL